MPDAPQEVVFRVYPNHCDMLGHLNHAAVVGLFEQARWVIFTLPWSPAELAGLPVIPVVRHVEADYRSQALPGDDLAVSAGVVRVGNTSATIRQQMRKVGSGELVAEANVVLVAISREGRPVPVPDDWKTNMPMWPDAE